MIGIEIPIVAFPDGEQRPLYFGMLGLNKAAKTAGVSLGKIMEAISGMESKGLVELDAEVLELLFLLFHTGFELGASLKKSEYPYTLDETTIYVFSDLEFCQTVVAKIAETMPRAKEVKADAKKKTKTRPTAKAAS